MSRIIVVGSSNTDMILRCDRLPKPGETVLGSRFSIAGGGKGANQAVAAARLGADVTFVARLGQDWMGDQAVASYRTEGIHCDYITRDDAVPSGVALIMVDSGAENFIGVAPGANATLLPEHIVQAEPAFRSAKVLLLQLEIPLETIAQAIELADKWNVSVILNPAPARDLPAELLRNVTLTPNQNEAAHLAGIHIATMADVEDAAKRLLSRGVRTVIITLGEQGAFWATRTRMGTMPGFRVRAVDTTAAGDAFNAGLAVAQARGDDLELAVRYACAVGALAVTQYGAQPSLPTISAVETFLRSQD